MRQRGFSYLEVLVSVFIVTASIAIVAATLPIATTSRTRATTMDKAMALAQKELEKVRGSGYANLTATQLYTIGAIDSTTASASSTSTGLSPIDSSTETFSSSTYTFTNSDSAVKDSPAIVLPSGTGTLKLEQVDTDVRRVTITVSWSDRGTTKSYSTGTLICNL